MTLVRFTGNPLLDRLFDSDVFDWTSKNYSKTNTTFPSVNVKEKEEHEKNNVTIGGFDDGCSSICWLYSRGSYST